MTLAPDTPYMTPADVRAAVSGLSDTGKYPDALLVEKVAEWEGLIEGEVGRAFTPRTFTATVASPDRGRPLILDRMDVTEITAISYDVGTAPTLPDGVTVTDGWSLSLTPVGCWWPHGTRITYSGIYGPPTGPPALVLSAGAEFVRAEAIQAKSDLPRNVAGTRTDLGWEPAPVADPKAGRLTRWLIVNEKVDQIRRQYGERAPVIG